MDDAPGSQAERSRDFDRFLTFVDAVVAIAITLLVLPLVDVAEELGTGPSRETSVLQLLRDHEPELYAFVLSFVVIANLWFTQHHVVRPVVEHDAIVSRLMVLWLLAIVFLPFPTALVAEKGSQTITKVLYLGTMTLSSVVMGLMAQRIRAVPKIREGADATDPVASWVTALLFALALVVTLAVPATGYYPLLLLLLTGVIARGYRRLRGGSAATGRVGD